MAFITAKVSTAIIAKANKYLHEVYNPLYELSVFAEQVEESCCFGILRTTVTSYPHSYELNDFIDVNKIMGMFMWEATLNTNVEFNLIETIASFLGEGKIGLSDKELATYNTFMAEDVDTLAIEVNNLKEFLI
jgi:hypothetical protein|tara:strand:+ start:288 stop:686 length:399 start_codon:yes stop_codon:yes gene_type:complete